LKIGQKVKVEKEGDLFYIQESPIPDKPFDGVKKWLHRTPPPPERKGENH
jgi:hypothetical protein